MRLYITIVLLLISSVSVSAQSTSPQKDLDLKSVVRDYIRAGRTTNKKLVRGQRIRTGGDLPFEKIGLSLGLGSDHLGLQLSTPINEKFKMRVGIGFMPQLISMNEKISITDNALSRRLYYPGGVYPIYDVDFKPNFFSGKILASYYPIDEVAFHITAGLYIGENTFKAKGILRNPSTGTIFEPGAPAVLAIGEWPMLKVEDYMLNIEGGILDADVKVGWIVKPYVGVGYGYVVPDTKWSFNADLGVMYQGSYKVNQFGREAAKFKPDDNTHESQSSSIDLEKYVNKVQFWPVLNLQVSYRIY